jgi:hypothetical protein
MKVRVLSPALDEIADAAMWFDAQRSGLGLEFWNAVEASLALVEQNPLRFGKGEFATSEIDVRFAIVRRFNYVIHFAIEGDEVQVAAVAHAARRPGYWIGRIKRSSK